MKIRFIYIIYIAGSILVVVSRVCYTLQSMFDALTIVSEDKIFFKSMNSRLLIIIK